MTGRLEDAAEELLGLMPSKGRRHGMLLSVDIDASTAMRRHRDALAALAEGTADGGSHEAIVRMHGEVHQAVLALYLAASTVERYCIDMNEAGPLGRRRLHELVMTTQHLRDAVMHWDEKTRRDSRTFIAFSTFEVMAKAPPNKRGRPGLKVAGMTWQEFEDCARRLHEWAAFKLNLDESEENHAK